MYQNGAYNIVMRRAAEVRLKHGSMQCFGDVPGCSAQCPSVMQAPRLHMSQRRAASLEMKQCVYCFAGSCC